MATINVETKFDIGDSVYGFIDGEIHNLIINRIEISVNRIFPDSMILNNNVVYIATTTDAEINQQHRINSEFLFTEESLKGYVDKYFKRLTY